MQRIHIQCVFLFCVLALSVWPGAFSAPCHGELRLVSEAVANPFTGGGRRAAPPAEQVPEQASEQASGQASEQGIGQAPEQDAGQPAAREGVREPSDGTAESVVPAGSGESRAGLTATLYTRFMRTITAVQKDLRVTLTSLGRDIAQDPGGRSFWMFIGLSFLYGVIHALGPGHGKAVVFAYFLGRRGSVLRGMIMGHVMTFVHVLSAVVLVFALQWGFGAWGAGAGSHAFDEAGCVLQRVSYSLVLAIGVFMACHALYELASGRLAARVCCTAVPSVPAVPAASGSSGLSASPDSPVSSVSPGLTGRAGAPDSQKKSYGSLLSVSVLAGLVPCPGAALVLAFSLSLNIPATGIAAMFALALGMGLTTSLFGVLSMASRSTLVYVAGRGPRKLTVLYGLLSVTGAVCIALVGALMLASLAC